MRIINSLHKIKFGNLTFFVVFSVRIRLLSPLRSSNLQQQTRLTSNPSCSSSSSSQYTQQQTRSTSNRSPSSSQYLQRQAGDRFVKARLSPSTSSSSSTNSIEADTTFVARSAFKLLHLQSKWNGRLIKRGQTIIDLGAAPGSWIQAARVEMDRSNAKTKGKGPGRIIGVDLLPLTQSVANLPNVHFVQGNFLDPIVQAKLVGILRQERGGGSDKVDLVLSDMLANLSGNPFRDSQLSIDLCYAALQFALVHLSPSSPASDNRDGPGGKKLVAPSLIMKCLQSSLSDTFQKELLIHFGSVKVEKPEGSRPESREVYLCCSSLKNRPSLDYKKKVDVVEEEGSIYF